MRIIKNAKKVIVSDALITDNVLNLLTDRANNKKIYIDNIYKKFEGTPAILINDEEQFLDKLKDHCVNKDYFLFGCDSCNIITKFYNECVKISSECILITAESKLTITDASIQFKDKFIFYSPSIVFGVDVSLDKAQDVFIYINGKNLYKFD